MQDNKSRLSAGATRSTAAAITRCEVLRGAFPDARGHVRHGKVDLPDGHTLSASSADPAPVLLTTENGAILDVLGSKFPALAILRVQALPLHPVTASSFPVPRYDALEIKTFAMLRSLLRRAVRDSDASLLGHVATASARIHQRRLPKPHFDVLLNIGISFGACGLCVSHGASVAALVFDAEKRDLHWSMQAAARALRELGISRVSHLTCLGTAGSLRSI